MRILTCSSELSMCACVCVCVCVVVVVNSLCNMTTELTHENLDA